VLAELTDRLRRGGRIGRHERVMAELKFGPTTAGDYDCR